MQPPAYSPGSPPPKRIDEIPLMRPRCIGKVGKLKDGIWQFRRSAPSLPSMLKRPPKVALPSPLVLPR